MFDFRDKTGYNATSSLKTGSLYPPQKQAFYEGGAVRVYAGQYYDQETGLYYNYHRYYDPVTGRYLQTDPYREGLNLYAYCHNNPNSFIDPRGLCAIKKFFTLQGQADFWAGFGDFLTSGFGLTYLFDVPSLTEWIRGMWNDQFWGFDVVNYGTDLYVAGAFVGDIVGSFLGEAVVAKALSKLGKGAEALSKVDDIASKSAGRTGKQAKLRELADNPKVSSADRGWIKNEMRHIETGNRETIRLPGNSRNSKQGGKVLAHERGKRAKDGFGYEHSNLQDTDLHKLEHKYEGY